MHRDLDATNVGAGVTEKHFCGETLRAGFVGLVESHLELQVERLTQYRSSPRPPQ
jgi:hypothetical protein